MEESKGKKFTNWIQDSLQAIIVIIIALAILFLLVYFYSKKSNNKEIISDGNDQKEDVIAEIPNDDNSQDNYNSDGIVSSFDDDSSSNDSRKNDSDDQNANNNSEDKQENLMAGDRGKGPSSSSIENENQSQEQNYNTDGVITVTANRGDSLTILARKATAQYISENNVEGLTSAHKIYIEDYLQKRQVNRNINAGSEVTFSSDSINSAIQSAKSLNSEQLKNLSVYTRNVSGL